MILQKCETSLVTNVLVDHNISYNLTIHSLQLYCGQNTLAVRLKNPFGSTIFSSTWHLIPAVLSYSYITPYSRWTLSTVRLTWSFFPSMIAIVLNLSITSEVLKSQENIRDGGETDLWLGLHANRAAHMCESDKNDVMIMFSEKNTENLHHRKCFHHHRRPQTTKCAAHFRRRPSASGFLPSPSEKDEQFQGH